MDSREKHISNSRLVFNTQHPRMFVVQQSTCWLDSAASERCSMSLYCLKQALTNEEPKPAQHI